MGMTHTIKDNFLAFKTSDQANISSLKAYFNPKQESTPTNGEIVPITGYNSISLVNLKKCIPVVPSNPQDIYYSNDNNYRIKYCGNNKFKLLDAIEGNSTAVFDIEIIPIIYKSEFNRLIGISTAKQKIDSWNFTYSLRTSDSSITKLNGYLDFGSSCQSLVTIIEDTSPFAGNTYDIIRVIFTSSILVDFEFSLVFTNSDDISMHNITFPAVGKNLLDKNTYSYKTYDSIIFGGTPTLSEPDGTLVLDAGTYTFSTSTNMTMLGMVHADGTNGGMGINTNYITFTCNTREKVRLMVLLNGQGQDHDMLQYNYQLEKGSTMTTYEPFNNTIYGGYINLITGQLIMDRALVTIDGTQTIQLRESFSTCQGFRVPKSALPVEADHFSIFDKANYMRVLNENEVVGNSPWTFYINTTNHALFFYLPLSYNTVSLAQQYLTTHPLQVCYTLLHPITYQFTPEQLETIKGENYFWSNTEGQVEITYQVHDSVDILQARKSILYNGQPHIKKISGVISSFDTDLSAPLKECKINFYPAQDSYANPSPTNVKSISGWNGIQLVRNNFLPIDLKGFTTGQLGSSNGVINYLGNNTYEFIGSTEDFGSVIIPIEPITFLPNTSYHVMVIREPENGMNPADTALNIAFKTSTGGNIFVCRPNYIGWNNNICRAYTTFTESKEAASFGIGIPQGSSSFRFKFFLSANTFTTNSINWSTNCGTLYGGYIDLINGKLVQTHCKLVFDGTEELLSTFAAAGDQFIRVQFMNYNNPKIQPALKLAQQNPTSCKYSHGKYKMSNTIDVSKGGAASNADGTATIVLLHLPIGLYTSGDVRADVRNYLVSQYNNGTPVELCYELATPIEYDLTPQQIKTLKGTNNIWSDANGDIEVKYWTH